MSLTVTMCQLYVLLTESVALLVARRTNNRKVVGSMPANVGVSQC